MPRGVSIRIGSSLTERIARAREIKTDKFERRVATARPRPLWFLFVFARCVSEVVIRIKEFMAFPDVDEWWFGGDVNLLTAKKQCIMVLSLFSSHL